MFGFSLQKLLVLAAIVTAVWYGFQWLSRIDRQRKAEREPRAGGGARKSRWRRGGSEAARTDEPEDMVRCPGCGAYVVAKTACGCGWPGGGS